MAKSCSFCFVFPHACGIDFIPENWDSVFFGLTDYGSDQTGTCPLVFGPFQQTQSNPYLRNDFSFAYCFTFADSEVGLMSTERKYIPIDCTYYDRLEDWATTKKTCAITYKKGDSIALVSSKILDLQLVNGVEYLLGESGFQLRLDDLISINGIFLEETNCKF